MTAIDDDARDWPALAEDDSIEQLATGALLVARDEYPELDMAESMAVLQAHAGLARAHFTDSADMLQRLRGINHYLFDVAGFAGNDADYYDPRNNYLNMVLIRRLGNPLSLAIVQIEVARRLGVPLQGISFPGHFLVRLDVDDGTLVMDPFNKGRTLDYDELCKRADPHARDSEPLTALPDGILQPAGTHTMLTRLLRNLQGIYALQEDWARVARCADRILLLAPDDVDAMRDRGLAYLHLGHLHGAQGDLQRYLRLQPNASDAGMLRERLIDASRAGVRLH